MKDRSSLAISVLSFLYYFFHLYKRDFQTPKAINKSPVLLLKPNRWPKLRQILNLGSYLKLSKARKSLTGGRDNNTQILVNTFESLLGQFILELGLEEQTQLIDSYLCLFI